MPARLHAQLQQLTRAVARGFAVATRVAMETAPSTGARGAGVAPPKRLGMQQLDKTQFSTTLRVKALKVQAKECGRIMKSCQSDLLGLPRFRNVHTIDGNAQQRLVLLKQGVVGAEDLSTPLREMVSDGQAEMVEHEVQLDYEHWAADEILAAILPAELPAPASFETIGHIAHLNLREQYQPYKSIIGQVLLDKNRGITSVVNKTDSIDTQFRFFKMEVLAGVEDTVAEVRANGCVFKFDFAKVFWNSRLHHEHQRLTESFRPDEIIVDVMAGVGPFAVPAGKRGCTVFANDLNPYSHSALAENVARNKVGHCVKTFNKDGREFVRDLFHERFAANRTGVIASHVIMNLPASALEFLDAFRGVLPGETDVQQAQLPMIHCYCFSHMIDEPDDDVLTRAAAALGSRPTGYRLHRVRSVAPNKDMFCLTFQLLREIAIDAIAASSSDEPAAKKPRLDES